MTQTTINWSECPELESIPGKGSGTRVPVSASLTNLEDLSIDEVVQEYPSIKREQVRKVLDFVARSADPIFPYFYARLAG